MNTYSFDEGGGGVHKVADQAPVAEAWRILLADHVEVFNTG